ncbi:hypothetical protein BH10ACT6_BH10ACT6_04620 [soil metagenome]
MKGFFLLAVGVAAGFVAAHYVSTTPQGKQFFDDIDARARDFSDAVVDGYKAREAELRAAADGIISDFRAR